MVLSGYDSAFEKDSLRLNSLLKQGVGSWVEIDEAGALVTEERPQVRYHLSHAHPTDHCGHT
jgi:hypothetical protein